VERTTPRHAKVSAGRCPSAVFRCLRRRIRDADGANDPNDTATHAIRLAKANRDILTGALRTAWKLRVDKNAASRRTKRARRPRT
jgi:hypothetical protein